MTYIVEETVDPLIETIDGDLRERGLEPSDRAYFQEFWQRVTDLRVLDPAMGSGHFLTKATGYLTEQVMSVVREQEIQGYAESDLRRTIAKECIYGVDVNGMAVELAKLSMWLETLAADQPLAFLDHHLKAGNSLVGSDISAVLSEDSEDEDADDGPAQVTLAYDFARTRRRALDHVMDLTSELLEIDNESLDDIHSMEDLYAEIRADPLYGRLFSMANVHTAAQFGLDVPEDADEQMARAIEDDEEWAGVESRDWFRSAQALSGEQRFFHWELEFPEVFFDVDGERLESAGFDAVVGNPPWLNAWRMTEKHPEYREQLKTIFASSEEMSGHWDFYVPFVIKSLHLCKSEGIHSFILPNPVLTEKYATQLRETLLSDHALRSILSFGEKCVFAEVDRQCAIYSVKCDSNSPEKVSLREVETLGPFDHHAISEVSHQTWLSRYNHQIRVDSEFLNYLPIMEEIEENHSQIGNFFYVNYGAQVSSKEKGRFSKEDVVLERAVSNEPKFFEGGDISRYYCDWSNKYLNYRPEEMYGPRDPALFESEKIAVSVRTAKNEQLSATYDDSGMYCDHTAIVCGHYSDLEGSSLQLDFDGYERHTEGLDHNYVLAQINSTLITWFFQNKFATGALQGSYSDVWPASVRGLPVHQPSQSETLDNVVTDTKTIESAVRETNKDQTESVETILSSLAQQQTKHKRRRHSLNLDLHDHLGGYDDGPTLTAVGFSQPPAGAAESILQETTETRTKLSITEAVVERDRPGGLTIALGVRYKPDDPEAYETDQYGYRYLDPEPALHLTDLSEREADLIETFVPVAVEEAEGFAGFRANATKTNSPMDRLGGLTLPKLDDVADGLANYLETRERAQELDERIERTDALIDEIVYELYGLTDEEIEIVEEAVGE